MTQSSPARQFALETGRQTLPELLKARAAATPDAVAQWRYTTDRRWLPISWAAYERQTARLAIAVGRLGVEPGDRVGIMAPSSERWDWVSMAVLATRGVVVGIDVYATSAQIIDMAERAGLVGLVVGDTDLLSKVDGELLASLNFVLLLSGGTDDVAVPGVRLISFDELEALSTETPQETWDRSLADDAAILIFTSGTSGAPKGILYRHRQVRMAIDAILEAFPDVAEGSRLVCWLPLSNIFQRVINLCAIARGAQNYYVEDPKEILERLPRIAPHVFIGVPRFFEKQYIGIQGRLDGFPAPLRNLGLWALRVGDDHARAQRSGQRPSLLLRLFHQIADVVVLRWIRKIVWGGQLRYLVSGSAPMPVWLLEGFHALGMPVLEAYGLSECIVPVACNRPGAFKFGTVGQAMRGNDVKLGEDGELLLRGPGVFEGYWGESESECTVDSDGFYGSGDFAELNEEGYIRLTGRKSEVFKTSTGRRVAPAPIEGLLRCLPYVEDAAVYGAGHKALIAVLCLSSKGLAATVQGRKPLRSLGERLELDVERVTQSLPAYLRPKGFLLTLRPFTIEGGELTANLKLRRSAVAARYGKWLDELYAAIEDDTVAKPFRREVEAGTTEILSL